MRDVVHRVVAVDVPAPAWWWWWWLPLSCQISDIISAPVSPYQNSILTWIFDIDREASLPLDWVADSLHQSVGKPHRVLALQTRNASVTGPEPRPYSGQDSVTLLFLGDDRTRWAVVDCVVVRVRDGIMLVFNLWSETVSPLWGKQRGLFKYPPVIIKLNFSVSGQTHVRIFPRHSWRLENNLLWMLV